MTRVVEIEKTGGPEVLQIKNIKLDRLIIKSEKNGPATNAIGNKIKK